MFVTEAFAEPLESAGIGLYPPRPQPGSGIVYQLLQELNLAAAHYGRVLAGGVSLGGHVAAAWALRDPSRCAGLLIALPGWSGLPAGAPAAAAAEAAADEIEAMGLEATLAAARAGSPRWLGDELDRAWRRYGVGLAASLRAAAATPAPSPAELRRLDLPVGIAALTDDPLHPPEVAQAWLDALPRAALVTTSLTAVGRDRRTLGRAAVLAWLRADAATW